MRVYELTELLQKSPDQGALVMFDIEPSIKNGDVDIIENAIEEETTKCFSINDVLVGTGTLKGFVFLADEVLTD